MEFELNQKKGQIWNLETEDGRIAELHLTVIEDLRLFEKSEISEEEFTEILKSESIYILLEKAKNFLDMRQYSKKELFDKLYKYEKSRDLREKVIEKLEDDGLLNDDLYAENLARYYMERKHSSIRMAEQKMIYLKGISKEICEECLEDYAECERENLKYIFEKKYAYKIDDPSDHKQVYKVKTALYRLGFYSEDINDTINEYFKNS